MASSSLTLILGISAFLSSAVPAFAQSTSVDYVTSTSTVISCAQDVTDCPASSHAVSTNTKIQTLTTTVPIATTSLTSITTPVVSISSSSSSSFSSSIPAEVTSAIASIPSSIIANSTSITTMSTSLSSSVTTVTSELPTIIPPPANMTATASLSFSNFTVTALTSTVPTSIMVASGSPSLPGTFTSVVIVTGSAAEAGTAATSTSSATTQSAASLSTSSISRGAVLALVGVVSALAYFC